MEPVEVTAWQHIYGNFHEEQSPRRRGGFQTAFYTRSGLTEGEIEEMETRLAYFPSENQPVKRVFFVTKSGKPVVAQVVPLAGSDALGREGLYLAHGLAFAPEALTAGGLRPHVPLAHFHFATSIAEALERGDAASGDIPEARLTLPEEDARDIAAAKAWPADVFEALALCAVKARELAQQPATLAFVGRPEEAEAAMRAALLAAPAALVRYCSFDTYFHGCNPVAMHYWAVGLPQRPTSPRYLVVDIRSRSLPAEARLAPSTAYERWAVEVIRSGNLERLIRDRDAAFALGEWLDGRPHEQSRLEAIPESLASSVLRVNRAELLKRTQAKLREQYFPALAEPVSEEICRRRSPLELFTSIRRGFQPAEVLEALDSVYGSEGFQAPEREEVRAVGDLLARADHPELRLVHHCWTGRRAELQRDLGALASDAYRGFLRTALRCGLAPPPALMAPGRGADFLSEYLAPGGAERRELLSVVEALIAAREAACLELLAPHVAGLPPDQLKALGKICERCPEVPRVLGEAVTTAIGQLPPPGGLKGFVRSFLRRSPTDKRGPGSGAT